MKNQKLTFRQKTAYAHWSSMKTFRFPLFFGQGLAGVITLIYIVLAFCFWDDWIMQLMSHGYARLWIAVIPLSAAVAGFFTAYVFFFIGALVDKNNYRRWLFLTFFYKKG